MSTLRIIIVFALLAWAVLIGLVAAIWGIATGDVSTTLIGVAVFAAALVVFYALARKV